MHYPSKLVENAVEEISKLPGIGKKTALRLALHILKDDVASAQDLALAIVDLRTKTVYCESCHSISDDTSCSICKDKSRSDNIVCVVEDTKDVLAIENTNQYKGRYHVLGGIISPIEGIGPEDLNIDTLLNKISGSEIKEVILALSPTMEGDTTAYYLTKKLKPLDVRISTIARGIPVGGELEYADEITLGRSILTRTEYNIS